ncbi:hypothetical protein [Catellatospora chokoriensis]|uniref:Circularly permuted type 2 ATP-grasp protein n=1 Tax=Catellatospora chokoriensis TaxID=310353 RepID=A0A8J3JMN1_9ACTN|nr:hypothetical protein [Catellatospora chokoriensis]GIF87647.1 hypothetical protein Cch02nite_10910 [Catellatospora chokoriensis]
MSAATTEEIAQAFTRLCRDSPVLRSVAAELAGGKYRWEGVNGGYLARPVFASLDDLHSFVGDLLVTLKAAIALPRRLFDGDLDRYCSLLGIDERRAGLMRRPGTVPTLYGRADALHDGTGFKLLETGLTSAVGAVEQIDVGPRRWMMLPEVASFVRDHRLGFVSAAETLVRLMREAAGAVRSGRDPVVVLAEGPGGLVRFGQGWAPLQRVLRNFGIDCRLAELGDLELRRNRLLLRTDSGDVPVDVVFRCFNSDQVLGHRDGPAMLDNVIRAHSDGLAVLWSHLSTELFSNKGCLALLSDPRWQGADERERQAIDRILPWTRLLTADDRPGLSGLLAECRERRTELILKPFVGYGGQGVIAGWECDQRRWDEALDEAATGNAIVQARVRPAPERVYDPRADREEPWDVVHGILYSPHGYTGSFARALPTGTGAVINITTNPDTRLSAVFHHGEVGGDGGRAAEPGDPSRS